MVKPTWKPSQQFRDRLQPVNRLRQKEADMSELFESVIAGLDTPAISVGTMLVLFTMAGLGLRHFVVSSQLKKPFKVS